ncbi:hypothetical protein PICMEDRAFT_16525 [Pichia membranifaciens NRRL Y-2026]|uniref:Kinetochore-associated protein MTW1 n=1 Tax=Pichia membranifaciens NRRL Y-2026 TaxID=763406 RepID=A0A1E3NKP4_9ASCO|nr:hypothetical protein PICMEDRAFT_16525 [Pichia membranifaciens NRRL Y-2026]ODQ46689.1 hypothetical protein PICMEDRAFT_16525 [Pichia membranifaciens NRRL Y-2026]
MNEEEIQLNTTRLLTEHFGFQPITVIDDIINVINEIMYRCTEQLEQILINQKLQLEESANERLLQQRSDDIIVDANLSKTREEKQYSVEDIQTGTATLESLLEHSINRNFDKFEVYALRNVFTLPEDLVSGGHVRLKHHEGLQVYDNIVQKDREITQEMLETVRQIQQQVEFNKVLCDAVPKFQKLARVSKLVKMRLQPLIADEQSGPETRRTLAQLTPLNDTIFFLVTQLRSTCDKVNAMKDLISNDKLAERFRHGSKEEQQLNQRINVIIEKVTQGVTGKRAADPARTTEGPLVPVDSQSGQEIIDFFATDSAVS